MSQRDPTVYDLADEVVRRRAQGSTDPADKALTELLAKFCDRLAQGRYAVRREVSQRHLRLTAPTAHELSQPKEGDR